MAALILIGVTIVGWLEPTIRYEIKTTLMRCFMVTTIIRLWISYPQITPYTRL